MGHRLYLAHDRARDLGPKKRPLGDKPKGLKSKTPKSFFALGLLHYPNFLYIRTGPEGDRTPELYGSGSVIYEKKGRQKP